VDKVDEAGSDGVQLCSIQLTQFTETIGALRGLPIGGLCTVGPISPDQDIYIAGDGTLQFKTITTH
jgi:hypothetical protein